MVRKKSKKDSPRREILMQVALLLGASPRSLFGACRVVGEKAGIAATYLVNIAAERQNLGEKNLQKIKNALAQVNPEYPGFVDFDKLISEKTVGKSSAAKVAPGMSPHAMSERPRMDANCPNIFGERQNPGSRSLQELMAAVEGVTLECQGSGELTEPCSDKASEKPSAAKVAPVMMSPPGASASDRGTPRDVGFEVDFTDGHKLGIALPRGYNLSRLSSERRERRLIVTIEVDLS